MFAVRLRDFYDDADLIYGGSVGGVASAPAGDFSLFTFMARASGTRLELSSSRSANNSASFSGDAVINQIYGIL